MAWVKIDDAFSGHPKVDSLLERDEMSGLAALGLWVLALSKAGQQLTDGDLTARAVQTAAPQNADRLAADLVEVGLWERFGGGWKIHDYLVYNEPREVVLARRAADAEKKREARAAAAAKRRAESVQKRVRQDVPPDVRADVRQESPRTSALPGPARPDPTFPSYEGKAAARSPEVEKACDTLAAAAMHIHDRDTVQTLAVENPGVDIVEAAIRCANWGRTRSVRHPLLALRTIVVAEDAPRNGAVGPPAGSRGGKSEFEKAKEMTARLMEREAADDAR